MLNVWPSSIFFFFAASGRPRPIDKDVPPTTGVGNDFEVADVVAEGGGGGIDVDIEDEDEDAGAAFLFEDLPNSDAFLSWRDMIDSVTGTLSV